MSICFQLNNLMRNMSFDCSVKLAKSNLRKEIGNKLCLISKEERQRQSEIVKNKLFNLEAFKKAERISTFLSLDTEIDTEPMVRKIFEEGKRCFVPRYNKKVMEMVELHSMEDWKTLPLTKWNIKQPSFSDVRANALDTGLDLIIMPGVAFTKDGCRLGHGGGYYDRFLKTITENQEIPPLTVAVAFKEQIVESLPMEDTDVKINIILYSEN